MRALPVSLGPAVVTRVDSFQLKFVFETESPPANRQPSSLRMVPPEAVMDPSQFVAALSPIPSISRYEKSLGAVTGVGGVEVWGNNRRRPPRTASTATTASRTRVRMGLQHLLRRRSCAVPLLSYRTGVP